MNSQQLIVKAERALRTGQPNLATLYMVKALTAVSEERCVLQAELQSLRLRLIVQLVIRGLNRVLEAIPRAVNSLVQGMSAVGEQR